MSHFVNFRERYGLGERLFFPRTGPSLFEPHI